MIWLAVEQAAQQTSLAQAWPCTSHRRKEVAASPAPAKQSFREATNSRQNRPSRRLCTVQWLW